MVSAKSDFAYDYNLLQWYGGPALYHYFGPQGKSFFTVMGVGLYVLWLDPDREDEPRGGYLIGAGYQFTRNFQAAAYVSGGLSTIVSSFENGDLPHNHVTFLINAIAF